MENRENNSEKKDNFEDPKFDPTKDAFFSDLENDEEEIASEAYELVAHALSLVEDKYYDDAIEILRQAIGLYSQINKESEKNALHNKISEIYLLKEQNFQEIQKEVDTDIINIQIEKGDDIEYEELYTTADNLIVKGVELVNSAQYDGAINTYREAIHLLQKINKISEIEKVKELLDDCYVRKAEEIKNEQQSKYNQPTVSELELKTQRIQKFKEDKEKETQLSTQAYELLGRATDLVKVHNYDEAIKFYEEGAQLFQEINWINEVKKITTIIGNVQQSKEKYLSEMIQLKRKEEKLKAVELEKQTELLKEEKLEEEVKEKAKKARELVLKKQEEERFKKEITSRIDYAELLAREYDIEMKKGIKEGKLVETCIYPSVIKIYEEVKKMVDEQGWKHQSEIYSRQIKYYKELLDKDSRLRNLEAEKIKKEKEFEESFKLKKMEQYNEISKDRQQLLESERLKEQELVIQKKNLENLIKEAEKIARDYSVSFKKAVKKGNLELISQYPRVIEIYSNAKKLAQEKGWLEEIAIYTTQIRKYTDLLEKENKVRQLEAEKAIQEEEFKEIYKTRTDIPDYKKFKRIEPQKPKKLEDEEFQKEITSLVDKADKMGREYEIHKKKAIKEGKLPEKSPYLEIIELYTTIRNKVVKKGWNKQALIYANQIKIYQEKLENDIKLRQIEQKKILDQQEFEKLQKAHRKTEGETQMLKAHDTIELDSESEKFQEEITHEIDKVEKEAREYEMTIKKGEFEKECPYLRIAEVYKNLRGRVMERGWKTESEAYSNQIKYYQEKYENDIKLRQIEQEKIQRQLEFEKLHKVEGTESDYKLDMEKMLKEQEISEKKQEEEKFEKEIDENIDQIEKEAREYELAIKKGDFEKECPYLQIAEIYKTIREKVLKRGWRAESEIYSNQIQLYLEKFERDKRLRELELEKVKKQEEYEKVLKISQENKTLSLEKYQTAEEKVSEEDILLNDAMDLINYAENEVRSYELSLKKDILVYSSPYEKAIKNYEEAKKLFLKIGWKEEAKRLDNTISFYREKKVNDDNLRELEKQKLETSEKKEKEYKVEEFSTPLTQEFSAREFKERKEKETKLAEPIFDMINIAERKAQEYENSKREGILNIKSPFDEILSLYQKAKKGFLEIGWVEQADQIDDAIRFYNEKYIADQKLRSIEKEKILKDQELARKIKLETQLAKEAEEELQKQKIQAIELKKKQSMEYEMKKEQAFNLMDLAKKELKKENFDRAINLYSDCEHIFAEINWPEGIQMVRESVTAIKMKKEKIEKEIEIEEKKRLEKLKIEEEIQEQIIKAQDLKREQEEQRRKELMKLEKEKDREKSISQEAYKLLQEGTLLKDKKKFEQAFEKYAMARDLFKKIDWQHEVSRINNDLMFILKKEMKQAEKIKVMLQKKEEEEKELEILLKEAEERRLELEIIKKEERRKEREKIIQEELDKATNVIKDLRYNKGVFMIKLIIKKLSKKRQEKLIKQLNNQIQVLENASQVPIITLADLELDDNLESFKQAYEALDDAQISLSENLLMKAISELNEAKFKLKNTKIGKIYIPVIVDKINSYKKELGIEIEREEEAEVPKLKKDDLMKRISERRAERKKRLKEILGN